MQMAKSAFREVKVLAELSKMPNNLFTVQLLDVILPSCPDKKSDGEQTRMDKGLFLVLEWIDSDLRATLDSITPKSFTEEHIVIILYNLLCAVNYIHSANLMHRDIKPANVMITRGCGIKICDFGLARTRTTSELDCSNSLDKISFNSCQPIKQKIDLNDKINS